ncbi:transposase [Xylella taiwanensis]|nr:transposase [Xylella taiwanensis]
MVRAELRWYDVPMEFGSWHIVYRRFPR